MATLYPPGLPAPVEVADDDADRYLALGWSRDPERQSVPEVADVVLPEVIPAEQAPAGDEGAADDAPAATGGDGDDGEEPDVTPPPRGGPGSGKAAWLAYASANGVEVAADANRDDIIAALEAGGVPTE